MRTTLFLLLSLAAFWPAGAAFAQRELDAMQLATGEGVVVLKNGRTLHGDVSRLGDQLLIRLAAGGEIRVPFSQSLVIAQSLEEAYEIRRDALQPSAVDDRAKLIEWCLQEDLLHRAADQVLALSKIDPRHPKLPHLERRLLARAKASPPSAAYNPSSPAGVTQAAAIEAAPPLAPNVDPRSFFAETVQSQLVFGCAAAKCHGGPAGKNFQLRPYPIALRPVDEITNANFAAVREFLGDGGPKSPALSHANRAHAGPTGEKVHELLARLVRHLGDLPGDESAGAASGAFSADGSIRTVGFASGDASPPAETNPYDPAPFNLRYHGRAELPPMP